MSSFKNQDDEEDEEPSFVPRKVSWTVLASPSLKVRIDVSWLETNCDLFCLCCAVVVCIGLMVLDLCS